ALPDVAGGPLEVGEASDTGEDVLALDLLDDVTTLDPGLGRRTALLDTRDEHALGRLQVEPLCELGGDGPYLESEQRTRPPGRAGASGWLWTPSTPRVTRPLSSSSV